MKKNSFTEAIYKNAGYLVVALISAVYIAGSLINISRSGRSIYEILGTGVLSLIVGIMINGVFRSIGLRKGDEDERTVATNALHAKAVEEITPYIDRLDSFCERESRLAKRAVRTRILACEGMKYSDYFDGDDCLLAGVEAPKDKRKRRVYFKALRTKIKPLLSSNLTSDGANASNPFDFGKSKREYASTKSASDVAVKLIMAIVFGYFGVSLTGEINIASLIWNTLQIVLYVAGGVIQMYSSFSWVVDDYRAGVIKKIDMLQKFKALALAQATQE
ncbi:MAG: hypothetical protein IJX02_09075 [Clostridia bacterium]|nr:hypothetical protein [Clostridia bacterium]